MDTDSATIFDQLDSEWERLRSGRQLDRALVRWRHAEMPLHEFASVSELLGLLADRHADPQRQSEALLALLRLAPRDPLAARLVLQRFTPALKAIAGWKQPMRHDDWAGMVVAAGYEVIVTYPVERRPARVAANIVWDVRKRMFATLADHRRWQDELSATPPAELPIEADAAEGLEAVELVRWAAARTALPRDVASLIVLTRAAGVPLEEVAARCGVPSSRLRQQRWRGEQRMRKVLVASG